MNIRCQVKMMRRMRTKMSRMMLVMPDENDDEDEDQEDHVVAGSCASQQNVLLRMVLDGNHTLMTLVASVP